MADCKPDKSVKWTFEKEDNLDVGKSRLHVSFTSHKMNANCDKFQLNSFPLKEIPREIKARLWGEKNIEWYLKGNAFSSYKTTDMHCTKYWNFPSLNLYLNFKNISTNTITEKCISMWEDFELKTYFSRKEKLLRISVWNIYLFVGIKNE